MTIKKIKQQYLKKEMVVVCCASHENYNKGLTKTLEHKIDGAWFEFEPPIKDYEEYSDGFCEKHLEELYPKIYKRLIEKRKTNNGNK